MDFGIFGNQYVAGTITGVMVSVGGFLAEWLRSRKKAKAILSGNEGLWLEVISEEGKPITYSLGEFEYRFRERAYFYDGVHYGVDGIVDATWRSGPIQYDAQRNNLLYVYEVRRRGGNPELSHGFGFIDLQLVSGELQAQHGYFVNAEDLTAVRRTANYYKANDIARLFMILPPENQENKNNLIRQLYSRNWVRP